MKRELMVKCAAFAAFLLVFVPSLSRAEPGYELTLSGPKSVRAGQSVIVTARGVNPTNGYDIYFLSVIAFDSNVVSTCPAGTNEAVQLAQQTNSGAILARTLREQQDTAGRWSIVVGGRVGKPGRTLICGYTHDGLDSVMATATLSIMATRGRP